MTLDILFTLILFAVVTSITPGPNNFMLLASGVNYGFTRTIPHMLGIGGGFLALLLAVGFGLGALFERVPMLFLALKIAGGAYLLYLAYRIAFSRSLSRGKEEGDEDGRPMTFVEAALFQWVNPKAWVMAVAAMATYTDPSNFFISVLLVGLVFAVTNVPCVGLWAGFGVALRGWLSDPARLKWFNITMGVLLVICLWPMLK